MTMSHNADVTLLNCGGGRCVEGEQRLIMLCNYVNLTAKTHCKHFVPLVCVGLSPGALFKGGERNGRWEEQLK